MRDSSRLVPLVRGPAVIALAAIVMGAGLFGISVVAGAVGDAGQPPPAPAVRDVGARVTVTTRDDARVAVQLPSGWGVTREDGDLLWLASPARCHTATVKAFPDDATTAPKARAKQMLGYVAGGDFSPGRAWSGTVDDGRGFVMYDPELLLGVEAVARGERRYVVLVHGMPGQDRRCAADAEADVQRELSQLLEGVRIRTPRG